MAAATAMRCEHSPNGGIHWLRVALDVLHWVMRPTLYRCITMAIGIVIDFACIFVVTDIIVAHNIS